MKLCAHTAVGTLPEIVESCSSTEPPHEVDCTAYGYCGMPLPSFPLRHMAYLGPAHAIVSGGPHVSKLHASVMAATAAQDRKSSMSMERQRMKSSQKSSQKSTQVLLDYFRPYLRNLHDIDGVFKAHRGEEHSRLPRSIQANLHPVNAVHRRPHIVHVAISPAAHDENLPVVHAGSVLPSLRPGGV